MPTASRLYPDWKAPSEDGEIVVWPDPASLVSQTQTNQKQLKAAEQVRLQQVPLPQVRTRMRQFIGHDDAQPLIATGHQTELHHPGVWVKNAVIDTLSREVGGRAVHLAVDTDAPKHLLLRWPGGAIPLTDDPRISTAAWCGQLNSPTPAHVAEIQRQFDSAASGWQFSPVVGEVLGSLRRLSLEAQDLPSSLTNAMHELDWSLGLKYDVLLASPIWISDPFLLVAHDLLSRADEVAAHYNAALSEYRAVHGIANAMRPMPDLATSEGAVEVPFWLDDLQAGTRSRPSLFRSDRGWILELLSGEEFIFDPHLEGWESAARLKKWLNQTQHRLTPRALMLMLFTRVAWVDQFVHGIGGGQYDQVTDRLIELLYGMPSPAFGVSTATLYFPGVAELPRVCVPCVKQEGHRARHGLLGPRKQELVAQIAALPRHSPERSTTFFQMHSELAARAEQTGLLASWQEKLHETQAREREEQTLFDRELFYAIQPRERLEQIIRRIDAEFA